MDVETSVRDFLREHAILAPDNPVVSSDESLLDSGILDSASIFQLVGFLEERFNFVIPDEDLVPDNFETIDSIAAFVRSRAETQAAGDSASE